MNNDTFAIDVLGTMKFIVSLIDYDYPRAFVCKKQKKTFSELELFIFDEIDCGDDYVEWICAQISINDLDRLNRGIITLESCFFGPREGPKPGYKIISKNGENVASALLLDDVSLLVTNNHTFVEQFVPNSHGVELMSLVYESPFLAVVAKDENYADPMIDSTRVAAGSNEFKTMANAMPYGIETRFSRMCYSSEHSVVIFYELSDKKSLSNNQILLSDSFEQNCETRETFKALDILLSESSTNEQIINAFKGDKKSIEKAHKFISEIKKNNKKPTYIQAADYSSGITKPMKTTSRLINDDVVDSIKKRSQDVYAIIDSPNNHIINEFHKTGQFLMLDTTGRKRFKFQSTEKDDYGVIYSGFSDVNLSLLSVDDSGKKRYVVRIKSDTLFGEFGKSKPSYTLMAIEDYSDTNEQLTLIE